MEQQRIETGGVACAARVLLVAGALAAALAVIMGAFGAHALKDRLGVEMGAVYRTAVDYHIYHAFGLLAAGLLADRLPGARVLRWSGALLGAGIVLFSGSLYALSLGGPGWLGGVTPFGGLAFIGGWALLALGVLRCVAHRARG